MTPHEEDYLTVELSQQQVTKIDAQDYQFAMQRNWHAVWNDKTKSFYASTNLSQEDMDLGLSTLLSRQLMGLRIGDPRKVDHFNHDTLDNRRKNLRIATTGQNAMNSFRHQDGSSKYKGVSRNKSNKNPWHAQISKDRVKLHLGDYSTEELARDAYLRAAEALFGEFAYSGERLT